MASNSERSSPRVLIVGISTRAAAESAARAGFDVTALDAFADLDQHPSVHALSLPRDFGVPFTVEAVVDVAREIRSDAFVYLSCLENYPDAVAALASGRSLWGNHPHVLHRIRNPVMVSAALAGAGLPAARVSPPLTSSDDETQARGRRWLTKPLASGGGHGIRIAQPGEIAPPGHYHQEYVEGVPGSVVFVANGESSVALGVTRQLVGESAFGVSGFRYCGSLLSPRFSTGLSERAATLVKVAASLFGLVGVGSLDFIARVDVPWLIEVNPRWTSSMELVERSRSMSIFALHVDACTRGALPPFDFLDSQSSSVVHGKAIVFARRQVTMGDTQRWLDDPDIRDVPWPGERIAEGQPICTVFARGDDEGTCHHQLVRRAEQIYSTLP